MGDARISQLGIEVVSQSKIRRISQLGVEVALISDERRVSQLGVEVAFFAPPDAESIVPDLISSTNFIPNPVLSKQVNESIVLPFISSTETIPTHNVVLEDSLVLTIPLIASITTIPTHIIAKQLNESIDVNFISSTEIIFTSRLSFIQAFMPELIVSEEIIFDPTIVAQIPGLITSPLIPNTNQIFDPILQIQPNLVLDISLLPKQSFIFPPVVGDIISTLSDPIPFVAQVPPSILEIDDGILHEFLTHQGEELRQQHLQIYSGESPYNFQHLLRVYDTLEFALGSRARFLHPDFGIIRATFVEFSDMIPGTPTGSPVGYLKIGLTVDWKVTNDLTESGVQQTLGFLASTVLPLTGQFGWVITGGANIQVVGIKSGEILSVGTELVWFAPGEISGLTPGNAIARHFIDADISGFYGPGELLIDISSTTGRQGIANLSIQLTSLDNTVIGIITRIDTFEVEFDLNNVLVVNQITGLQASINVNSAQIVTERNLRISGDSALASKIDIIQARTAVTEASIVTEQIARATADTAFAGLFIELEARFESELIDFQSSVALVTSESTVTASLLTATATQLLAVEARVETAEFDIIANASASVDFDARITVNEGDIIVNAAATVTLDARVTVNEGDIITNASATVTLEARTLVNEDDIVTAFAKWSVVVDVNGNIASLELISGLDTKPTFRVSAALFEVFNDTDGDVVFEVSGGVVKLKQLHISDIIQSDIWNPTTKAGWQIDKAGNIIGRSLEIYDSSGVLIFGVGGVSTAALIAGDSADTGIVRLGNKISASNIATFINTAVIIDAYIGNLAAGKITTGTLSADRIAVGTLNADKLIVGTIITGNMQDDSITEDTVVNDADSFNIALDPSWTLIHTITLPTGAADKEQMIFFDGRIADGGGGIAGGWLIMGLKVERMTVGDTDVTILFTRNMPLVPNEIEIGSQPEPIYTHWFTNTPTATLRKYKIYMNRDDASDVDILGKRIFAMGIKK